jgi:hypothetical protein
MVLAGRSIDEIESIVTCHTYRGMPARMAVMNWSKV